MAKAIGSAVQDYFKPAPAMRRASVGPLQKKPSQAPAKSKKAPAPAASPMGAPSQPPPFLGGGPMEGVGPVEPTAPEPMPQAPPAPGQEPVLPAPGADAGMAPLNFGEQDPSANPYSLPSMINPFIARMLGSARLRQMLGSLGQGAQRRLPRSILNPYTG